MALKLIANYSKRLGLPGYSSHQFAVTVETEISNISEVAAESTRRAITTSQIPEVLAHWRKPALAGGYFPAEIDPEVRKVTEFAVKTQAQASGKPLQLVKILKVERQGVTGLNYRMEIEEADGNKHFKARAVVWKKLDGTMALTSWK